MVEAVPLKSLLKCLFKTLVLNKLIISRLFIYLWFFTQIRFYKIFVKHSLIVFLGSWQACTVKFLG